MASPTEVQEAEKAMRKGFAAHQIILSLSKLHGCIGAPSATPSVSSERTDG